MRGRTLKRAALVAALGVVTCKGPAGKHDSGPAVQGSAKADAAGYMPKVESSAKKNEATKIAKKPTEKKGKGFDLQVRPIDPKSKHCTLYYPMIEDWAKKRKVDPAFVRAFALSQSAFEEGAAAKVCSNKYDGPGCFTPGLQTEQCYNSAYAEMYDPGDGQYVFDNAPNSEEATPDWKWCGLGMMQTLEPPYTFWPASDSPTGKYGVHHDIYARSPLSKSLDLDDARGCAQKTKPPGMFNPFNAEHSVCLGTKKLQIALQMAKAWIKENRKYLNWGSDNEKKDDELAVYIAGNIYSGLWDSNAERSSDHPRCSASISNGECWAQGFYRSWTINNAYCEQVDGEGQFHHECKDYGKVKDSNPPYECYNYQDILQYIHDCEIPFMQSGLDHGLGVLRAYMMMKGCMQYQKRP